MMISVPVLSSSSPPLALALPLAFDDEPPTDPPEATEAALNSVSAELTTGVIGGKRVSAGFCAGVAAIELFGVILVRAASTAEVVASVMASRTASDIVPAPASPLESPPKNPPSNGAATLTSSCICDANHESKSSPSSPSMSFTLMSFTFERIGVACRVPLPRPPYIPRPPLPLPLPLSPLRL